MSIVNELSVWHFVYTTDVFIISNFPRRSHPQNFIIQTARAISLASLFHYFYTDFPAAKYWTDSKAIFVWVIQFFLVHPFPTAKPFIPTAPTPKSMKTFKPSLLQAFNLNLLMCTVSLLANYIYAMLLRQVFSAPVIRFTGSPADSDSRYFRFRWRLDRVDLYSPADSRSSQQLLTVVVCSYSL